MKSRELYPVFLKGIVVICLAMGAVVAAGEFVVFWIAWILTADSKRV